MSRKIVNKYEIIVYDTGEADIKPITLQQAKNDYTACSSRISQILSVVNEINRLSKNNTGLSDMEIYLNSINYVSKTLGVQPNTIADKLTRQLGKNADTIRQIIFDYIRNGSSELKDLLINNVGRNTKYEDIESINSTLE